MNTHLGELKYNIMAVVWEPKPTEHCVLCVQDNEKKVPLDAHFLFRSLSLSFVLSPSRSRSLSLSLHSSLCALRSALLSLNITANDDESGETGDSNGRVKTLARRPLSRTVGREKWFAPWRVPVVHIRARRPTGMFTTDTDEDFQLIRLR